jgi:hypothetical protein
LLNWPIYRVVVGTIIMFPEHYSNIVILITKRGTYHGKIEWLRPKRENGHLGGSCNQEEVYGTQVGA